MARDPDRIGPVLRMVGRLWRRHPDMRLGQLIASACIPDKLFYVEDDELLDAIRGLLERENGSMRLDREEEGLKDVLAFYADPETYFAVAFLADPPAGEFMDDFSETELGMKPGRRARRALGMEDGDG